MASEIRVDKITSLSGVGTITPSVTGVEIAGITTVTTLKATTGIVTTLTATTGIVTTFEATIGNITTLRAPTGIVTTLTATTGIVTTLTTNTLIANSTTKVGSGITLSPDGDIFTTGITTFTDDVQFIGDSGISSITYDKSANQLNFVDNARARFGSGGDLNIYHNGVASFIKNDTGALRIPTSIFKVRNAADSEDQIVTNQNGSVELFHNNTRRFQTTGAGISVSQTSGGFSEFHHAGSNSGVRIAGPAGSSGANLVFANNYDNSTNDEWAIQLQGSTDDLLFIEGGHSGNERLRILETGGITFNGDTATANALDDYEEGTWTPAVSTGTNSSSSAIYTKIGRLVNISARVETFSNRTSGNNVSIGGLPFAVQDATNMGSSVFYRVANTDDGHIGAMVTGSDKVQFLVSSQGGSESWFYIKHSDLNNSNTQIRFNVWYITTA
tara:strand:- start:2873 stop:4201 length:1329 start_codon:yes stop_codon:yes gene_type:complete